MSEIRLTARAEIIGILLDGVARAGGESFLDWAEFSAMWDALYGVDA